MHEAAGRLLAAGISIRHSGTGDALLEFAAGTSSSTTIRWNAREGLSIDDTGYAYQPPTGRARDPRLQHGIEVDGRDTRLQAAELLKEIAADVEWRVTGVQNERLRSQREIASRFRRLHRQLTRWADTEQPEPGGQGAHHKIQTLAMAAIDCDARITAERGKLPEGRVQSLTITVSTGPEARSRLSRPPHTLIVIPENHELLRAECLAPGRGHTATIALNDAWRTTAEYWTATNQPGGSNRNNPLAGVAHEDGSPALLGCTVDGGGRGPQRTAMEAVG